MNSSPNVSPATGEDQSNGLIEVRASELRPGDRVTFGDHTGWLLVSRVEDVSNGKSPGWYRIDTSPLRIKRRFPKRPIHLEPVFVVRADETVWVKR